MNREEFQEIVDEIAGKERIYSAKLKWNDFRYQSRTILTVEWATGGYSGGNCWDDSDPQPYYTGNVEQNLHDLDKILEKVCPTISFLQYKLLCENIKYGTRTEYEYYGNSTTYSTKSISVDDIWSFLVEKNLVG
jgi:hypothetical protein